MAISNLNQSVSFFTPPTALDFRDNDVSIFDLAGWQYFSTEQTTPVSTNASENKASLNTTSNNSIQAGFFNRNPIASDLGFNNGFDVVLDSDAGYLLSFTLQVIDESGGDDDDKNNDGNRDRAGFSVIVTGNNPQNALELIFFTDGVAALEDGTSQPDPSVEPDPNNPNDPNVLFTQAEAASIDNQTSAVEYDLKVLGDHYTLFADGNSLLTGNLRDYTDANVGITINDLPFPFPPSATIEPYKNPNFIFLGDDTPSAQAQVELQDISLDTTLNLIDLGVFPENLDQGASVGTINVNGNNVEFSIIGGNVDSDDDGQNAFVIDSNTGEITVNDPDELNFQTNPNFNLEVKVTDGDLEDFATVGISLECFLTGTLIKTENGDRPVETLKIGDRVITAENKLESIKWIGIQTYHREFAHPLRSHPVCIKAGALGDGLPKRDLYVSPDHALYLEEGILANAGALINNLSIIQIIPETETFLYYHIELENHSLLLAEGTPAESYLAQGDRLMFDNGEAYEENYAHDKPCLPMDYPRASSKRQIPRYISRRLEKIAQDLYSEAVSAKV